MVDIVTEEDIQKSIIKYLGDHKDEDISNNKDQYKLLMLNGEILYFVDKLAKYINNNFKGRDIVITCILKGAVYFFVDLTRRLTIPYSVYFIESSSYCDNQTQDKIEILSNIVPSKFNNKHVILIDELYDNGKTLETVKNNILEQTNIASIFTCTMFIKKKNIHNYPLPDLCGAHIPDLWVIGYGLDDKQTKRGWIHLFAVPKNRDDLKNDDDIIFDNTKEGIEKYEYIRKQFMNMMDIVKNNICNHP